MTWSYTGDLINNPIDKIRFTLGDTNELAPLFQDEELQSVLTLSNDSTNAAIRKCFLQLHFQLGKAEGYTKSHANSPILTLTLHECLRMEAARISGTLTVIQDYVCHQKPKIPHICKARY